MELIYRGAEAVLYKDTYLDIPIVRKKRKKKDYRTEKIDERIRKGRTKKEARRLKEARKSVKTPYVFQVDPENSDLLIEYIEGETLKERIKKGKEKPKETGEEIGRLIKGLHEIDLVHNDLTTSNMIRKNGEIYFIDFGLSEKSSKIEDKAMDLLVFKKMLKSTHWKEMEEIWKGLAEEYGEKSVLGKLEEIERRGRYTEKKKQQGKKGEE